MIRFLIVAMTAVMMTQPGRAQEAPAPGAAAPPAVDREAAAKSEPPAVDGAEAGSGSRAGAEAPSRAKAESQPNARILTLADGETQEYAVRAGYLTLFSEAPGPEAKPGYAGPSPEAEIFYLHYSIAPAGDAPRPILFYWGGGPGGASAPAAPGFLGPRQTRRSAPDETRPAWSGLEDMPETLLTTADLVFMDPVGAGYSRPAMGKFTEAYYATDRDADIAARFVEQFIHQNRLWTAPVYIGGVSYGSLRAAYVAQALAHSSVRLEGAILFGAVASTQHTDATLATDDHFILTLPTLAATARYHRARRGEAPPPLQDVLTEAETFAKGDYAAALSIGEAADPARWAAARETMSRLIGIDPRVLDAYSLRMTADAFERELLRNEDRALNRYDTRYSWRKSLMNESALGGPSPYSWGGGLMQILGEDAKFASRLEYVRMDRKAIMQWRVGDQWNGEDSIHALGRALQYNPPLRLFFGLGVYDMRTPYFGAVESVKRIHALSEDEKKARITIKIYESGHATGGMEPAHYQALADLRAFIDAGARP